MPALGIIQKNRGATERALELFEESRALKRRIGDLDGAANSEHGRALVQLCLGRVAQREPPYRRCSRLPKISVSGAAAPTFSIRRR